MGRPKAEVSDDTDDGAVIVKALSPPKKMRSLCPFDSIGSSDASPARRRRFSEKTRLDPRVLAKETPSPRRSRPRSANREILVAPRAVMVGYLAIRVSFTGSHWR